jgi:beta-glucosidase-like glycosyl hydrolase
MKLEDKCKLTGDGATTGGGPILELGIPKYSWNTEALHGLAAACLTIGGKTRCPTVFPAPPGLGATFNLSVAHGMGETIGDETRAMNNFHGCRARGGGGCGWGNGNWFIGLNVWVPNLNVRFMILCINRS